MPGTPKAERSSRPSSTTTEPVAENQGATHRSTPADLDWSSFASAVITALPDALVVCDRFLSPLLANDAGSWLLREHGGWSHHPAVEPVQAAVAAALDRSGVSTLAFTAGNRVWEARATPIAHPGAAAVVLVRATDELDERRRDAILRRAHDLKAPLHAVDGFTTILLKQTTGRLNPRQRHMLEITAAEVRRFRALLERLLDLARTGGVDESNRRDGRSERDTALVSDVLKGAIDRLAGASSVRNVHLELQVNREAYVSMPPDEVTTVAENLLTNALNALPQGGEIVLSVDLLSGDTLRWTVHDTGPGIPVSALERVFEPYFRIAHLDDEQRGGTGLGLAISRALVQARGGRITVANHPGGGAIFAVELPVAHSGASRWPRLHLAPVLNHSALAGARAALDVHIREGWQILHWDRGIFTVEVNADVSTVEAAAAHIAASTSFACWRDT